MSGAWLNYTPLGVTWNKSNFQKYACNSTAPKIAPLQPAALPAWIRGGIQSRHSSLSQQDGWEGECLKEELLLLPCQEMLHRSVGPVRFANKGHSLCGAAATSCFEQQILWWQLLQISCTWSRWHSWVSWNSGFADPKLALCYASVCLCRKSALVHKAVIQRSWVRFSCLLPCHWLLSRLGVFLLAHGWGVTVPCTWWAVQSTGKCPRTPLLALPLHSLEQAAYFLVKFK